MGPALGSNSWTRVAASKHRIQLCRLELSSNLMPTTAIITRWEANLSQPTNLGYVFMASNEFFNMFNTSTYVPGHKLFRSITGTKNCITQNKLRQVLQMIFTRYSNFMEYSFGCKSIVMYQTIFANAPFIYDLQSKLYFNFDAIVMNLV